MDRLVEKQSTDPQNERYASSSEPKASSIIDCHDRTVIAPRICGRTGSEKKNGYTTVLYVDDRRRRVSKQLTVLPHAASGSHVTRRPRR